MSQNSQHPFSMWMDMNKTMVDAWNEWTVKMMPQKEEASENPFSNVGSPGNYYDMMKNFTQNPMFSFMSGNVGRTDNPMGQFYDRCREHLKTMSSYIPNSAVRDGFDRFMNSYRLFSGLQNFWDSFIKNMPADITDPDAFSKPVFKFYEEMTATFMQPFMPDQLRNFLVSPFENFGAAQRLLSDFFKPFLENSAAAQAQFFKAMTGDKDAYMEFLESWKDAYKNSAAKIINMPAIGSNRVMVEKMMKFLDCYVDFVSELNEYSLLISNMLMETLEKLLKHLSALQAEGKQPRTFMEFYNVWSEFNERAFETVFSTDEFAKIMNDALASGSKLKIIFEDLLQDMFEPFPLPNMRDFDSVCEEVFRLRKRVKELEKELKALKQQAAANPKT